MIDKNRTQTRNLSGRGILKTQTEPLQKPGELSVKENPKLEKLRKAPEEVIAKAIREMLRKDHESDGRES